LNPRKAHATGIFHSRPEAKQNIDALLGGALPREAVICQSDDMSDGLPASAFEGDPDPTLTARGQRYAALVANSPYCIHEIDAAGDLCSMNPAGLRMMNAADECEVVGLGYLSVVCEEDLPRIARLLQEALAGRFSEFEFTTTTGRVLRSNFVPLGEQEGVPARLMGITQDVTERKELERQILQSRQLDAIGRLAGGVAHDFNNLLTVIMGSADRLQLQLGPTHRSEVDAILKATSRAANLTSQLLAFGRLQRVSPRRVDLGTAVVEARGLLAGLLGETARLEIVGEEESLIVLIDPDQLDRVLVNLTTNAADAMGANGGLIRVSLQAERLARGEANPARLLDGAYARLQLSDDGCGMPPEVVARLFEPFFTTKSGQLDCHGGTGLGLATCHGLVGQAGGGIAVESEVGAGTTVSVYLPLVDEGAERPAPSPPTASPASGVILLVEDEQLVRHTTRATLELGGYTVIEAASAEQALELPRGGYDLLLTDMGLPERSGYDLAADLLAERPELRVIFISGRPPPTDSRARPLEGRTTFLAKPFRAETLLEAIATALTSRV
jgi:two-component system, cell cycle sensor histidine kinase and response regulator CckA